MDIGVEVDAQFFGGFAEGVEGIPSSNAIIGAGTEADIPFAYPLANGQFSRVVVQGHLRMIEDQQEPFLFGQGLGDTAVKGLIASDGAEEFLKVGTQAVGLGGGRRLSIVLKFMIEVPELGLEAVEQLLMMLDKGCELLVMATFMNPAKRLLLGDVLELSGIITEQNRDDRGLVLFMIGGQGSRFQDACLLLFIQSGGDIRHQECIHLSTCQDLILRPIRHLPLDPHRRVEEVQPGSRLLVEQKVQAVAALEELDHGQAVLARTGEVGAVVGIADDMAMLIFAIDPCTGVINMLPLCARQTGLPNGFLFFMPLLLVL